MIKKTVAFAMALITAVLLCACGNSVKTITFNEKFIKVSQMTPEELAEDLKGYGSENYESIKVNGNGTVSIKVTEEQRLRWVEAQKELLKRMQSTFAEVGENYQLIFDDNLTSLALHFSPKADMKLITNFVMNSEIHCAMYQLFSRGNGDDWKVTIGIYNSENGKLVTSGDSDAGLAWRAEDWEN